MLLLQLFEGREEYIANQYGNKLVDRYYEDVGLGPRTVDDPEETALDVTNRLAAASKKYLNWVTKQYLAKQFRIEDTHRLKDDLAEFDRVKNQLQVKDINQYPNLRALYRALDPYTEKEIVSKKQLERNIKEGGATKVGENKHGSIYEIHTKEAACLFGKGTKWCTAATKGPNYFDDYNADGPLYVAITKPDNEKYQFHFPSSQFMDEEDEPVGLRVFAENYPGLLDICIEKNLMFISSWDKSAEEVGDVLPLLSRRIQEALIRKGFALYLIPEEDRTLELCMFAWKLRPANYRYFPAKLKTLKMSIQTAEKIQGTDIYWADVMPKEHIEKVREYFSKIKSLTRAIESKKDYTNMLEKLQGHASQIKPEHINEFNALVDRYKQDLRQADEEIAQLQAYMKKIQPQMNKP